MKTAAIVQARMSSTRLPGKVLLPLKEKPALWHVLNRLKHAKKLDTIVLATSNSPEDRVLKEVADGLEVPTFFGDLDDVLSRYYHAAKTYKIDPIVRITADCPVIDPQIVDEVVQNFIDGNYDYYGLAGAFPDGLDVVCFSFRALSTAFYEANLPSEREHVGGAFFERNHHRFKTGKFEKFTDRLDYRWTLDEPEDYEFLKIVFNELYEEGKVFSCWDIFELLERQPELTKINTHIIRNEGLVKSLEQDRQFEAGKGKQK